MVDSKPSVKRIFRLSGLLSLQTALILLIVFSFLVQAVFLNRLAFLPGDDSLYHVGQIAKIASGQGIELTGYPPLMHLILGFLALCFHWAPDTLLLWSTVIIVSLLPVTFYFSALAITKDRKISLLTSGLSFLFIGFPAFIYNYGGFPFLWGTTLLPMTTGLLVLALERKSLIWGGVFAFSLIVLFFVHAPEFVTALIFILAIILGKTISHEIDWGKAIRWVLGLAFIAGFPLVIFALQTGFFSQKLPAVLGDIHYSIQFNSSISNLGKTLGQILLDYFISPLNLVFLAAFVYGTLRSFQKKRSGELIPLFMFIFLFIFLLDSLSFQLFKPFYDLIYPWSLPGRLWISLQFPFCLLAANGFFGLAEIFIKKMGKRKAVFIPVITINALLFIVTPFVVNQAYLFSLKYSSAGGEKDEKALEWIRSTTASDSVFLNDASFFLDDGSYTYRPTDAGGWIEVLTHREVIFPYPPAEDLASRKRLLTVFSQGGKFKELTAAGLPKVDYIYYGSQKAYDRQRSLELKSLLTSDCLMLVYASDTVEPENLKEGEVYIFKIKK